MNRKKIILIIPILIFIIILFIIDTLLPDKNENELEVAEPDQEASFSPVKTFEETSETKKEEADIPSTEKINISSVETNNFYNEALNINSKGDAVISDTSDYMTVYQKQFNSFIISVLGTPFDTARELAEKDFLKKLEIEEDDACKLDVKVNTPRFANPDLAGKTFKLSFCED